MIKRVESKVDFVKIEHKILDFWKSKSIFDKRRALNTNNKHWSFIDGPITAVIGPSIKDQCLLLVFRALLLSKIDLDFQKSRILCSIFTKSTLDSTRFIILSILLSFIVGKLAFSPRTTKRKTRL